MGGLPSVNDPNTPRHFTRSSVKPRFLFPPTSKVPGKTGDTTDEEAVTDIEYPQELQGSEAKEKDFNTPAKNRCYVTPPTTGKASRTTGKRISPPSSPPEAPPETDSPFTVRRATRGAFDGWQSLKPGSASAGTGRKRNAQSPEPTQGPKRQRSRA